MSQIPTGPGAIAGLVIGGGPAGLAAAIHLNRRLKKSGCPDSVVLIEKAPVPGYHNLSGACLESACLDSLLGDWRAEKGHFTENPVSVTRDEMYFLFPRQHLRIPHALVPPPMHHRGDLVISVARLCEWLSGIARKEGVEVYNGFSAKELIIEDNRVCGVKLSDQGRTRDGEPKSNFIAAETVRSRVTILAEGTRGVLTDQLINVIDGRKNPPVYSLGIKALVQLSPDQPLPAGTVMHCMGWPLGLDIFGGGFLYGMSETQAVIGLIMGLDWPQGNLNPFTEFEAFRNHPFIAGLIGKGKIITTGARTIPEGGYYSLPRLGMAGALIVGDAAGLVNMRKIKGVHYAIYSGMAAAEAVAENLAGLDLTDGYQAKLEAKGVLGDMRAARNFRQVFRWGLLPGMPLSQIQQFIPFRIPIERDADSLQKGRRRSQAPPAMDQTTFVSLTGSLHREDEPSHITIPEVEACRRCAVDHACACTHFCPGQVYRWSETERAISLSPSNCVHCMTCSLKCPYDNITWTVPEGGEGPRYKLM